MPTVFRFHDGRESQELDPLIASIEGIASTPAYRGLALAVFENLELAEFGNRIPFITAEIIGDAAAPTVGAILNDAAAGLITCDDERTIVGYAAHGPSINAAVRPLVDAFAVPLLDYGSQLRTPDEKLVMIDADRELGASADEPAARVQRERAAGQLPTTIRLSYCEPARDYQFGEARASVGDEIRRERQHELPAALNAASAKALAEQQLARAWAERDRVTLRVPTRHMSVRPGAILDLPLTPSRWLVERSTIEGFACILEARPCWDAISTVAADAGRPLSRSLERAETVIALFEAPATTDRSSERTLLLAASSTGPGWRSETVEVYLGPHRFVERTARRKSALGRTLTLLDQSADSLEVGMIDPEHWLVSCDEEAFAQGANLAMLGEEILQFRTAEPIGPGKFRLGGLSRGRCRTERSCGPHPVGAYFVLLERDALRTIALPRWAAGSRVSAGIASRGASGAMEPDG